MGHFNFNGVGDGSALFAWAKSAEPSPTANRPTVPNRPNLQPPNKFLNNIIIRIKIYY